MPDIRDVPDQRPVSWPASRLTAAEIEERAAILPYAHLEDRVGLHGLRRVLAALAEFPGASWQERWVAAGCDTAGADWVTALGDPWAGMSGNTRREESMAGLGVLISLDVIRPGYQWLHMARLSRTYQVIRELRDPEFVKLADEHVERNRHPAVLARKALLVISKVVLHTGKTVAEITPDDLVVYHRAAWVMRGKVDGRGDRPGAEREEAPEPHWAKELAARQAQKEAAARPGPATHDPLRGPSLGHERTAEPGWVKELAERNARAQEKLAEREAVQVPSEDPEAEGRGMAWPDLLDRERDPLHAAELDMRPSVGVLAAANRQAGRQAEADGPEAGG